MSQRRGLGRGLGALIPNGAITAPTGCPGRRRHHGTGTSAHQVPCPPPPRRPATPSSTCGNRSSPLLRRRSPTPPRRVIQVPRSNTTRSRSTRWSPTPANLARSSTKRVSPNWSTASRPWVCCSPSWSGRRRPATNWWPVSGGCGRPRWPGWSRIPALMRQTDDDAMLRDALLENLHRVQLNPLEEAAAYAQLMSDFSCTQEELAQRVGRSRPAGGQHPAAAQIAAHGPAPGGRRGAERRPCPRDPGRR